MKRQAGWGMAALLAAGMAATAASGQTPSGPQGPLGEPDASVAAPFKTKPKAAKKARAHAAAPVADLPHGTDAAPRAPRAAPTQHAAAPTAADPISLGFKWQGSNDTAERTRVQNYNGDAAGSGAAVGLKLHF